MTGVRDLSLNGTGLVADGARMSVASAVRTEGITPSDTVELSFPTRALYVGTSGDVKVRDIKGNDREFTNVPSGTTLEVQAVQVYSTDTTASDIVGLF